MLAPMKSLPMLARRTGLLAVFGLVLFGGVFLLTGSAPDPVPAWTAPDTSAAPTADHRGKDRIAFLFYGDAGVGTELQREVGQAMLKVARDYRCDFSLMLGDNLYTNITSVNDAAFQARFEDMYAGFKDLGRFDFWGVLGNHDSRCLLTIPVRYTTHSDLWRMPDLNYGIPKLPDWLHIYGLFTESMAEDSMWEPSDWALQTADKARAYFNRQPRSGWRVVFGHHPLWASDRGELKVIERVMNPLLQDVGAHFYLCGHSHLQEHISGPGYEQLIQGAGGQPRKEQRQELDQVESRFIAQRAGFGVAVFTPTAVEIHYFNEHGKAIYEWESDLWDPASSRQKTST